MKLKTTNRTTRTNTGYEYITYSCNSALGLRYYVATNKEGRRRRFYINGQRTREQAFVGALSYAQTHMLCYNG